MPVCTGTVPTSLITGTVLLGYPISSSSVPVLVPNTQGRYRYIPEKLKCCGCMCATSFLLCVLGAMVDKVINLIALVYYIYILSTK